MNAPLVVVAHGSRDPRSAATIRALVEPIGAQVSFLDLSEPLLTDVLRDLYAQGHRSAVVVPLLLGRAYHARVDLPTLVREVPRLRVSIADVLGVDPGLESVALDRLVSAGASLEDPSLGVVLSAVGSSHAPANEAVVRLARRWNARYPMRVVPAFASATKPDVPAAMARLRALGARRFAVASWFLAPGLLPDRIARLAREASPDVVLADSLAPDPRIGELVLARYSTALERAA
ncbi:sirohydrochlorin ferrochelatase [Amycolatopsis bartoniae]|uniref:Cobalamin biosynthesis protein n=1 Tax=Amycolatopsis bartoniae TaxID=941986 RepID=A0A8H9IWH3_9PSEU|nr:sirohydrochlorin chelatase [Amycolatopsis bartoniae]MBB2935756.1 sirohydrochlorin ferrochelatase [Amycolatopsis bartoniae]TVT05863.1 sirohydrochlorin chelatase [Amycolatopsis bartoniae]GHF61667.1 cobalamin biosynthesis protein [Amycolatopsis bartoniae]